MSAKKLALCAALVISSFSYVPVVHADDTGMAYMHDMRRERGRKCMISHWHYGSGTGRTKRKAKRAAIRSWQEFTAFEYGTDWARFRHARSKGMSCTGTRKSGFSCQVEARPCRGR